MAGDLASYWRKVARAQDFHVRAVVVREPRDRAVCLARDAVLRTGGTIADFRNFEDVALSMIVQASGARVLALLDALAALGWRTDVEPDREALARGAGDRLEGTVQLAFARAGVDLNVAL